MKTREEWLKELADKFTPVIHEMTDLAFPKFRVTCGFPSKGGTLGRKSRTRGQCWSALNSDDEHAEIFISPVENDGKEIAAILVHELIHAALPDAGHKKPFQSAAKKLGLEKPFTATVPTSAFFDWAQPFLDTMPDYPHARLNAYDPVGAKKAQKNRQLKCECEACGYICRAARSWIVSMGPPHCPEHGAMDAIDL